MNICKIINSKTKEVLVQEKNKKLAYDFDKVIKVFNNENANELVYSDNESLRLDLFLY